MFYFLFLIYFSQQSTQSTLSASDGFDIENDNTIDSFSLSGSNETSSTVGRRNPRKRIVTPTASSSNPTPTFVKDAAMHALSMLSQNDEFTAFGEFIAAELRRLSNVAAQQLKRKLNRTLLDFVEMHEQVNGESI